MSALNETALKNLIDESLPNSTTRGIMPATFVTVLKGIVDWVKNHVFSIADASAFFAVHKYGMVLAVNTPLTFTSYTDMRDGYFMTELRVSGYKSGYTPLNNDADLIGMKIDNYVIRNVTATGFDIELAGTNPVVSTVLSSGSGGFVYNMTTICANFEFELVVFYKKP